MGAWQRASRSAVAWLMQQRLECSDNPQLLSVVEAEMKTVFVMNGPNLNLLGLREPAIYGAHTLADVEQLCAQAAARNQLALRFHQSNHEGALIDWLHEAGQLQREGQLAGVVLNAAAYTHTSVALMDAIKGAALPVIELHISNVHARESFRHHSYIAPVAKAVICGLGVQGYSIAIDAVAQVLLAPAA